MRQIIPCLWFDSQAEEAANFYTSIFENSKIGKITRYPKAAEAVSGKPAGSVLTVDFELDGNPFVALNGGPQFKFSEAISLTVMCKDQKEIDYFWEKLTDGGSEQPCGWLKDKFGVSWQVVPEGFEDLWTNEKVMETFLQMKKINITELEKAIA